MRKIFEKFILTVAVAVPALFVSQAASARDRIVVYQDVNYSGPSRVITGDVRNLSNMRFNDIISSVRINGGTWEFCEHANYRGRCMTLRRDTRNFVPRGFNDIVSSIRKVKRRRGSGDNWRDGGRDHRGRYAGRGRITVYQDVNYGGSRRVITGNVRNLSGMRFNDIISSVRINGGTWEFCERTNYRGRCMTLRRDTRNFVPLGFNDTVSSIRKVNRRRGQRDDWRDGRRDDHRARRDRHRRAQITLYRGPRFRGRSADINSAVSDLRSLRLQDQVSSIRVDGVWQICSNARFRGRCRIVDRDISNLSSIGMDDTVSSVRPVDRHRRRR